MTPFDESAAVEAMARALFNLSCDFAAPFLFPDLSEGQSKMAATAALSALRPFLGDGWRTMESAPRCGTVFLAINASNPDPSGKRFDFMFCYSAQELQDGKHWATNAGWRTPGRDWPAYPTHWQPLPAPPDSMKEG